MTRTNSIAAQRSSTGLVEHLFEKLGIFVLVTAVFGYGLAMVFLLGSA